MRWLTNPVAQFLAAGFVTLVVVVAGHRRAEPRRRRRGGHRRRPRAHPGARPLGRAAGDPARAWSTGDAAAIDRLDRTVLDRLLVGDVRRIKIWAADGTVLYSDRTELIGARLPARRRRARGDRGRRHRRRALRPEPPREPLRARARRRPARGLHARLVAGGRAAALRGLLHRRRARRAARGGPRPVPADHDRRPGRAGAADDAARCCCSSRRLSAGRARARAPARGRRPRLRRRAAAHRPRPARRRGAGPRRLVAWRSRPLAARSGRAAASTRARGGRALAAGEHARRCARCSSRSTRPTSTPPGWPPRVQDLVAPLAGAGVAVDVDVSGDEDASDAAVALVWRVAQESRPQRGAPRPRRRGCR